jgi:uncharacterized membrane protein YhhN
MFLFLIFAAVFAILDWIAVATNRRGLEYLAKPAAMLGLILWYATMLPAVPPVAGNWFLLGMGLFLAGDIFLLMPPVHFSKGLLAFFLGYLAYIIAYNLPQPVFHPLSLVFLAMIAAGAIFLVRRIIRALRAQHQADITGPVIVFAVLLSLTFYSTLSTLLRIDWTVQAAGLAILGGGLCVLSDYLFAWSRYIKPIAHGRLLTTITYHLSQFFLATSILLFLDLLVL